MKRILLATLAFCMTISSFASPRADRIAPWDQPLAVVKVKYQQARKFDDPYVNSIGVFQVGTKVSTNYALNIQVSLNTNPPQPWLVTVEVWGIWLSGQNTRDFNITFSTTQWFRSVTYPLNSAEEPSNQWYEIYEGPQ